MTTRQRPRRAGARSFVVATRVDAGRARRMLGLDRSDAVASAAERPRSRAECADSPRPCPWMGCRHHLALDVDPNTCSIKLVHAHRDIDELADTCALDVADRGEHALEQIGELMNITRERVRQIELAALFTMHRRVAALERAL